MKTIDEILNFYRETYPRLLDEFSEFLSTDFDNFISASVHSVNVITEKPDFLSDEIWEHLFVKTDYLINREINSNDGRIFFLEINGVNIGVNEYSPGLFFAFDTPNITRHGLDDETIRYRAIRHKNELPRWTRVTHIKAFFNVCVDIYGRENVWFGIPKYDPNMHVMYSAAYSYPQIRIKHDDFWCEDQFGIKCKIRGGISAIPFNHRGTLYRGNSFNFGVYKRDSLHAHTAFMHPHTRSLPLSESIRTEDICRGDDSPINVALSVYVEDPLNEDAIFNLMYNYSNLLKKEDEDGIPYHRMRNMFLESTDSVNIIRLGYGDLIDLAQRGSIDYNVLVTNNGLEVKITNDSILDHINEVGGDSDYFIHTKDNTMYKRKLRNHPTEPIREGEFYFNDTLLTIGITPVDPNNYDLSGIHPDHPHWSSSGMVPPEQEIIEKADRKLTAIANIKLAEKYNVSKINHKEIEEELIGLTRVERRSDPDHIISIAESNRLAT